MPSDDFVFGTLSTDALRSASVQALRKGVTHNHARTPRDPLPGQPIVLDLSAGPAYPASRAWIYWTTDGKDPAGQNGVALVGNVTPMELARIEWDTGLWGYVRRFRAVLPSQPAGTVLRYRLSVSTNNNLPAGEIFADGGTYYACYIADDPTPDWAQDAIVYQIFVDRFSPGAGLPWRRPRRLSGFYGGTLAGITQQLDYITELGVNVLWLTPIFPSPSHHGYDATDYFDVEPRLGTRADLKVLLNEAHDRGIRLLLDFVANHWSSRHATFRQVLADPDSPYRDWYTFTHWPDEYASFFGVRDLPQVNLRHPDARQHMLDAACYWLDFGVDGYRLDYALGPAPDFWADFRRVTRQARPDCWTFGEVVEPSDRQLAFAGQLDGCLDFVLLEALRQAFAFGHWSGAQLASFLDCHEAYFPPTFSRPSFLDNHDMNRYLWAANNDKRRLRLAALCQFTLGGPPVVYYGTEVGLSQVRDVRQGRRGIPEEARLPMVWGKAQDTALLDFYRQLIALRRSEPALRRGVRATLSADADTLVYLRQEGGRSLLVALNLADAPRQLILPGFWRSPLFASDPACSLHLSLGETHCRLAPLSGMVLAP